MNIRKFEFRNVFVCDASTETLKKFAKKVSQSRNPVQKSFGHGRDSNPSFCLVDLKKSSKKLEAEASSVVAVSGSQLINLIKSVTSLGFKKVTTIV